MSTTSRLPRARAAAKVGLKLKPVTAQLAGGATRTIKLRLTRRQLRSVRAALAARRPPRFTVTVQAADAAGNRVTRTVAVKTKR